MTPQQNPQPRIAPLLDLDIEDRHWEVSSDEAIIQQCRNGYLSNPEADNARFFSFSNH